MNKPPDDPTPGADNIECRCILSKHWDISLIHASLSCTVDATKWINCFPPVLLSTSILKSRTLAPTDSLTLRQLPWAEAEQTDSEIIYREF